MRPFLDAVGLVEGRCRVIPREEKARVGGEIPTSMETLGLDPKDWAAVGFVRILIEDTDPKTLLAGELD